MLRILRSHRMTWKVTSGKTPFQLAFRTEAVFPREVSVESLRICQLSRKQNEDGLRANLDLLDKVRDKAFAKQLAPQQKAACYYNYKINKHSFPQQKVASYFNYKINKHSFPKITWCNARPKFQAKIGHMGNSRLTRRDPTSLMKFLEPPLTNFENWRTRYYLIHGMQITSINSISKFVTGLPHTWNVKYLHKFY